MQAKDIMVPVSNFIGPKNTVKEAFSLLTEANSDAGKQCFLGVPVLESDRRLIGMFSEQDLLKAVYPFYMSMSNLGSFGWDGMLESIAARVGDQTVETLMSRDFPVIYRHSSLMVCVDLFIKGKVDLLPVIDEARHMLGLLHRRNIISVITKAILDGEPPVQELLPLNSQILASYERESTLRIQRPSAQYL